jgi:CBS domain-containing protein
MTPDPVAVDADTPVAAVARLLLARSFNSLPVTEGGRLVGMIGRSDLLRLLAGDDPTGAGGKVP